MTNLHNGMPRHNVGPINVRKAFEDFCKYKLPDKPLDMQLKAFVKKYPEMRDYSDRIKRRIELKNALKEGAHRGPTE